MNIMQIRTFFEAAKCGSVSRAAETLFISQSTASKNIMAIEKELDVKLFEKRGRNLVLTDAGKAVLRYHSEILELYDSSLTAIEDIKQKRKEEQQTLKITGNSKMPHYGIIHSLIGFKSENEVDFMIDYSETPSALNALQAEQFDLAFCPEFTLNKDIFSWYNYISDELIAIVHVDSPLAKKKSLIIPDISKSKIITGPTERAFLTSLFPNESFHFSFLINDPITAQEFLFSEKDQIYIAPRIIMQRYKGSQTVHLPIQGVQAFRYAIAWKKGPALKPIAKLYLRYLNENPPHVFIEESLKRKTESYS